MNAYSIAAASLVWLAALGSAFAEVQPPPPLSDPSSAHEPKWFRGQLHAHTYWSDGRGFPEQAIEAYKHRGYDFLSLTEHNLFADDAHTWRKIEAAEGSWPPKISQEIFDAYLQAFGNDRVESRLDETGTSVRLKTYEEMKAQYDEPGKFLLLPGVEVTQQLKNGLNLHLNYINLPTVLPCIKDAELIKSIEEKATVNSLLSLNAAEARQAGREFGRPYVLILNHPFWPRYDIVPQNVLDCPEIRFFEVCNGGAEHPPYPEAPNYTLEKFWDVVNAFRCLQGQPLLYGVGTDDAHFYDAKRIGDTAGVGNAWIMVQAPALTSEHLMDAMHQGDFYASSGIFLDKAEFSPADKTLRVAVRPETGVRYRIHFITTKRSFDQAVAEIIKPTGKNKLPHVISIYSDDIGRIVKTIDGAEGEYELEPDDLYVRARIESDSPAAIAAHFHPPVKMAWTQPFTLQQTSP